MTLIDANLLLYAYVPSSKHHEAVRAWLEAKFSESEPVGLPWVVLLAFMRISTNPRILERPLSIEEANQIVSAWLARTNVIVLNPGDSHWEILQNLLAEGQAIGPLVTDAHLAALALEHGATLATADRDFARFPGVKLLNPLS
ncbi:MAG TPA: type II toxin-antitoxin system VapC family toxin [Terriglobia bacterium]|nr:type II toxin-antitoxin system VapC family toxin [Terriglobia bacterium]